MSRKNIQFISHDTLDIYQNLINSRKRTSIPNNNKISTFNNSKSGKCEIWTRDGKITDCLINFDRISLKNFIISSNYWREFENLMGCSEICWKETATCVYFVKMNCWEHVTLVWKAHQCSYFSLKYNKNLSDKFAGYMICDTNIVKPKTS